MGKEILSILCPNCAAPARYSIIRKNYHCDHCGSKIVLDEVYKARKELQEKQRRKIKEETKEYALMSATCKGCGASLIFNEGEAISECQFCGSSVVRSKYLYDDRFPENIIPFGVTLDEAKKNLEDWCNQNSSKREARHLKKVINDLKGYYLPYEMISGPVSCRVRRKDDVNSYEADGYVENGFVNCSNQLDNLVLDAMEPYDLSELQEFDFGYVAGQHVKISDIIKDEEKNRVNSEVKENYREWMNKIYNTKALDLSTDFRQDIRVPVLLPAYYIKSGRINAAVNGQTGKVSVKAEKDSFYITVPWWLKTIFIFLIFTALTYGLVLLGTKEKEIATYAAIALFGFEMFLFLFMIRDSYYHLGTFTRYRKIFTSGDKYYKRENGELVLSEDILKEKIEEPMFEKKNGNKIEKVYYRFCPDGRMLGMYLLAILVVIWPVLTALIVNGFDFTRLDLRGSGIWLLITLPTAPVYLVRGAVQWLYESPWIYDKDKDGKLHRRTLFSKLKKMKFEDYWDAILTVLGYLVVPPMCLFTWAIIAIIVATVYFTAFGI